MPTIERSLFLTGSLRAVVSTNADSESQLTRDFGREDTERDAWHQLIDRQLIEWGRDPSQLDDEGTESPSRATILVATRLAGKLCRLGFPAPTRIVPDAHGGIVFEDQFKDIFQSIHVQPDGNIEYRVFKNRRLVVRELWAREPAYSE